MQQQKIVRKSILFDNYINKGWSKKTRPHENLTNANFKVLYRNK